MTIEYKIGNILDVKSGIIAHGCNCSGGFGSGIARQMNKKWERPRFEFSLHRKSGLDILGTYQIFKVEPDLYIANCYTQQNYGRDPSVRYADPKAILKVLFNILEDYPNIDIHVPKIGCGLGGLSWEDDVKPIYELLGKYYDFTVWSLD